MLDVLIKRARVVDGSGAAAYEADIAVQEGRIADIGDVERAEAKEVIDARGLVAAPGFIDMHSHSDYTLPLNRRAESKIRQGVTTEVIGMCGSSPAPLTEWRREEIRRQTKGYRAQLGWDWLTFGEYLDVLRSGKLSVNVVPLVGHGTIRIAAMGHSADAPTPEQLAAMKALVAQAMDEGAWGISTGLIYPPGCYSSTEEIIALAEVAAERDGFYFSHIRGEGETLLEATAEAIRIGEESGLPVEVAHFKASGQSNWGKAAQALELYAAAQARGVDVTPDMYPYTASSTGLGALLPEWAHEGGQDALLARLADPVTRARLYEAVANKRDWMGDPGRWDDALIARCAKFPAYEGKTIARLAAELGKDPVDTILDLLQEADADVGMIYFKMSEENVRLGLRYPPMMVGSDGYSLAPYGPTSEGKPHPRSYGTFVRVLAKYVRQEGVLTLEEAVRKMSALPAAKLRLFERGLLRRGYWADIVLFDPVTVQDQATFTEPHQYAAGVPYVLVNGQVTVAQSEHRGTLAGRVLEKP